MASALIFSCSSGGGHQSASQAIAAALRLDGGLETRIVNLHDFLSPLERRFFSRSQFLFWNHVSPLVAPLLGPLSRSATVARIGAKLYPLGRARFRGLLHAADPDVLIATHALAGQVFAPLAAACEPRLPVLLLTISYVGHAFHVHPGVTTYCVAHACVAEDLRALGVPHDRIRITGLPLGPVFDSLPSAAEARQHLGLPLAVPVVLISQGVAGTGLQTVPLVTALVRALPSLTHLVVLCGANERVYQLLTRLRFPARVRCQAMVDHFPLYLRAADVLIGKAGGLSSTEAFVAGTPLVLYAPHAMEMQCAERFVAAGAALSGERSIATTIQVTRALLEEPDRRRDLVARAAAFVVSGGRTNLTRVVQDVLARAGTPPRVLSV